MVLKKYSITAIIIILSVSMIFGFSINTTPLNKVFTEKSLYGDKVLRPWFVGDRERCSTCSGVAWFHDNNYLATVNFENGFICTYKFNKSDNQFLLLQMISGTEDATLLSAENLDFSSDGKFLAVSINHASQANIYSVDTQTHYIDPVPVAIIKHKDRCAHGVRFSHDNRYIACSTVRGSNRVTVHKLEYDTLRTGKKIKTTLVASLDNRFKALKPKSLDFSHDDKYLAIVYATNIISTPNKSRGLIAVYKFDKDTGIIDPTPISVYRDNQAFAGGEDINFSPNDSHIIISEPASDRIIVHEFDKTHGKIGKKVSELKNPESKLSFPHGLNISSDGKYLAVANYGDDKFSIYAMD